MRNNIVETTYTTLFLLAVSLWATAAGDDQKLGTAHRAVTSRHADVPLLERMATLSAEFVRMRARLAALKAKPELQRVRRAELQLATVANDRTSSAGRPACGAALDGRMGEPADQNQ